MDDLEKFLGEYENELWETTFPYCYAAGLAEGVYSVKSMQDVLDRLELGIGLQRERSRAEVGLDLALSAIWEFVSDQFPINLFPHRLAAATDVLRAVNFGRRKTDAQVMSLTQEVINTLNWLEATLAYIHEEEEKEKEKDIAEVKKQ